MQLWAGKLRYRCKLDLNQSIPRPLNINLTEFYKPYPNLENRVLLPKDFICSESGSGMQVCQDVPPYIMYLEDPPNQRAMLEHGHGKKYIVCNRSAVSGPLGVNLPNNNSCVNWNQYYRNCSVTVHNPYDNAINFDNIGFAWVAIFQVISLESWVDIMYYVQDAHSFWDWIYFVSLIVIGTFFMLNLCLVVIATQFSETKKRETERMLMERRQSCSTLTSSEASGCYGQLVKVVSHHLKKLHRRIVLQCHNLTNKTKGNLELKTKFSLRGAMQYRRRRRRASTAAADVAATSIDTQASEHGQQCHSLKRSASYKNSKTQAASGKGLAIPTVIAETGANDQSALFSSVAATSRAKYTDLRPPRASPEMSDIDVVNSPRRPNILQLPNTLMCRRFSEDSVRAYRDQPPPSRPKLSLHNIMLTPNYTLSLPMSNCASRRSSWTSSNMPFESPNVQQLHLHEMNRNSDVDANKEKAALQLNLLEREDNNWTSDEDNKDVNDTSCFKRLAQKERESQKSGRSSILSKSHSWSYSY